MGLQDYRSKRDFRSTAEPRGSRQGRSGDGLLYVFQKHAARRLHYDLRLEHGGTLKSWAVPKGPSLDPGARRLAVEVEDHPLEYGEFEGIIPQGEYGAGSVVVWDRGTWEPQGDPGRGLREGKLRFRLHGEKLAGSWLLVRTEGKGQRAQWLLRRLDDGSGRGGGNDDLLERRPESVLSGRTLEQVGQASEGVWRGKQKRRGADPRRLAGAPKAPLPDAVRPQLATLVTTPPEGNDWLHEIKLDGYRLLTRLESGRARLLTRQGKDWTRRFGRLAEAAASLPGGTALLDGEVVALRPDGVSDFQALQRAVGQGAGAGLHLCLFDLLHLDGHDLTATPLLERKELLRELLAAPGVDGRIRYGDHHRGQGGDFFRHACELGAEGVVSKRADAPYRFGRTRSWLKCKCSQRQELVVVGFTEPAGSRQGFGALLLAYRDDEGALRYAGRVGTGFTQRTLVDLRRRLQPLERQTSPVGGALPGARERRGGVHWVQPRLVADVSFAEWTQEGILRHASFVGLREDVMPEEVQRERARPTRKVAGRDRPTGKGKPRQRASASAKGASPVAKRPPSSKNRRDAVEVAGVRLTHPDRVFYPETGVTKHQLADYYLEVAERMLPEISRRPLSLVRCPTGLAGDCFYQKQLGEGSPEALVPVEIEERSGKRQTYASVDSPAGLVALAQIGVLEIHPWGSRCQDLERPDRLILDLDPGPGVPWSDMVAAARELQQLLHRLGLESLPKLTGGKGLHVVVPVRPELDWAEAKAFARAVAGILESQDPEGFTTNPSKAKRQRRIFVDYLRNDFGATAVAIYSTRAKPAAPVAVPIRWDELGPRLAPDRYHLGNIRRRLAALAEAPWAEIEKIGQQRIRPEILAEIRQRG